MKIVNALVSSCVMFTGGVHASSELSSCASLVPNGHDYQVVITYDFEHGKEVKRFVGITSKKDKKLSKLKEAMPFVDCIKNEIKK